jgi:hypothetical protein
MAQLRVGRIGPLALVISLALSAGTATPAAAQVSPGPITPPFIVLAQLTSGSAVGLTTGGPFSSTTKLPRPGEYATIRWVLSPPVPDQHIDVYVTTRGPEGTWGPWRLLTARLTDAQGMAYFHWRSATPTWLSVQGRFQGATHLTPARAPAVQVRWRSAALP